MSPVISRPLASNQVDSTIPKARIKTIGVRRAIALGGLLVALTGCGDPLVARELVTSNRVLGARVEAAAASSQAWIAPSQSATVRWFVVGPAAPPSLAWTFSLCAAEPVARGLPRCAAPVYARFDQAEPSMLEPRFEVTLPDEEGLNGASQITVNGAFCETGLPSMDAPELDPTAVHCPDRLERPLLATMGIFVARNAMSNQNPSFDRITLAIDDTDWPVWLETEGTEPTCSQLGGVVPTVESRATQHVITFGIPGDLSETLETVSSYSTSRESLQLSHYVTAGDLERSFSDVDSSSPSSEVSLNWEPPPTVPDSGQLVRFFFVLRDGRGGADWTRRALCVMP